MLLAHTNSKVICFEPLPLHVPSLMTLASEYRDRFEPFFYAIGNECTTQSLFYGDNTELASLMTNSENIGFLNGNKSSIDVDSITLDSFFATRHLGANEIDLIKIDVEGSEMDVLLGSESTLKNLKPKFIQLEFNRHHLIKNVSIFQISKILSNYSLYQFLPYGDHLIKRDPMKPESNIYRYTNFLFVRNDISI
jgi:FkbM family methyltransferase